jgi:hypothetical protein
MNEMMQISKICFEQIGGSSVLAHPRADIAVGNIFIGNENGGYEQRHLHGLVRGGVFEVPPSSQQSAAPIEIEAIERTSDAVRLTFFQSFLSALGIPLGAEGSAKGEKGA